MEELPEKVRRRSLMREVDHEEVGGRVGDQSTKAQGKTQRWQAE